MSVRWLRRKRSCIIPAMEKKSLINLLAFPYKMSSADPFLEHSIMNQILARQERIA